jgi:putative transposase
MFTGVTLPANPTGKQKITINQWIGCSRFIWNAKCEEEKYLTQFARHYLPIGTFAPIDQTFSQYKSKELSPWLFECPSQILRNSVSNWCSTYRNFLKKQCGKPKLKKKSNIESIHLTRELFHFDKCEDGVVRLFIGTKTNNIGYLSIKNFTSYKEPNSLWLKRKNDKYFVSFCYDDGSEENPSQKEHLDYLKGLSLEDLENITIGIDRGIKRPVQAGDDVFDFTLEQKKKKKAKERYIKRTQKALARKSKTSKRKSRQKKRLAKAHEKIANIRKDFCHKTSRSIVDKKETKVIILEDLHTQKMTKKASQKSEFNRSILDKGWHLLEVFIQYKSYKAGKALFKVPAHHTSQECADCGHTHPDNRKTQEKFHCESCGHTDNADKNAAKVIKKRAINLILDSGTELSNKGVLLDKGRGAVSKTRGANASLARSKEASKKKGLEATLRVA